MQLEQERRSSQAGYAMIGLLVGIALMSVFLSVALPVWRTLVQREKEEELLWRGQQYARAILLYQRKTAAPGPPSVDLLVKERFLRRKYKDPITNDDFELVPVGTPTTAPTAGAPGQSDRNRPGQGGSARQPRANPATPARGVGQLIGGVRSKSKKQSMKIVNGRSVYNEWEFTYEPYRAGPEPTTPGGRGPRTGQPSPAGRSQRPGSEASGSGAGRQRFPR